MVEFCQRLYDQESRSPYLLAFLADRAAELVEKNVDKQNNLDTALKVSPKGTTYIICFRRFYFIMLNIF